MEESASQIDFLLLREWIADQFPLGRHSIHGPIHWERVDTWGQRLVAKTPGTDLLVVRLFAIFHDSRRFTEYTDPNHGARGAEFALKVHGSWYRIRDEQLKLLFDACEGHELGNISSDPTIGCCWDADRLDLTRVSIVPDPDLLSTDYGRSLTSRNS